MKILHGTWIPQPVTDFIQPGAFYLWVEIPIVKKRNSGKNIHPGHLAKPELEAFLHNKLGITSTSINKISDNIYQKYFALPTTNNQPLPSPELAKYLEHDVEQKCADLEYWQIDTYEVSTNVKIGNYSYAKVNNVIKLLNDIHFLAIHNSSEILIGSDLLFWYYYTQSFKQIILKDQYIPAFKYREITDDKGKRKQTGNSFEIYAGWEIVSEKYPSLVAKYADYMPLVCVAAAATNNAPVAFYSQESLLRHFSESLLHAIVSHTPSTAKFDQQIADTLLYSCLYPDQNNPRTTDQALAEYKQWYAWKEKLTRSQNAAT